MSLARLLSPIGSGRMPLAAPRLMAPEDAAAITLAAYLEAAVWTIRASDPTKTVRFKLNSVLPEWPNEDDEIDYPRGAISVITNERQAHNFVPTCLESTWDQFGEGTVLWKTDERQILFQVDFWVTNRPERQAIAAGLDEYFCPSEGRAGIMLEGPIQYWSQPIRFVLDSAEGTKRLDTGPMVFARDRRLVTRVICNIDDLQLRGAPALDLRVSMAVDGGPSEVVIPRPPPETV